MVEKARVTVVIIGRNEGERLIRCIESVRAMDFADGFEIVYVDSGSSDDSVERAESLGAKALTLPPGPTTAAKGRNRGLRDATTPFLFFIDGDTIVDPHFLRKAVAYLDEHDRVAAVFGDRRELFPKNSIYNRVLDLDWIYPLGVVPFFGGDVVVKKSALDAAGPYREDLIAGEEPELCSRIRAAGFEIHHLDLPMTGHDLDIKRFSGYWRRCYRTGHAYAEVAQLTNGDTFGAASRRNLVQAPGYIVVLLIFLILFKWWGALLLLSGGLLVLARTVLRSRWRRADTATTLLYAIHGHFCQFPIWLGQIGYYLNAGRRKKSRLIEYK